MSNPVTSRQNTLDQWRINLNTIGNNVGDPAGLYSTDGSDSFVLPNANMLIAAINDLNTRKMKRSGDTIANLAITTSLTIGTTLAVAGITSLTNNTASTSTTTGALVVTGGLGIGGTLNLGGAFNIAGATTASGGFSTSAYYAIGQYDAVSGSGAAWYNVGFRNDGTAAYLLQSAVQTTQAAARTATWNTFRPFTWNLTNGAVTIDGTGVGVTLGGALVVGGQISAPTAVISGAASVGTSLSVGSLSVSGATTMPTLNVTTLNVTNGNIVHTGAGTAQLSVGNNVGTVLFASNPGGTGGGFIEWSPAGGMPNTLNITSVGAAPLASLTISSTLTNISGRLTTGAPDVWCGYCNRNWYSNGFWSALPMDVQVTNVGGFGWSAGAQGVTVPVSGWYKVSVNGMGVWSGAWYNGMHSGIGNNGSVIQSGHANYGVYHYYAGAACNDIRYLTAGTAVNFFVNCIANSYAAAGWCWMTILRVN